MKVRARRHEGDSSAVLARADASLVANFSSWKSAEEAGVAHARLAELSDRDLLFWARGRPSRNLTGARLASWDGGIALRGNVWVKPSVLRDDVEGPLPFMSRRGMLDGAKVLGVHFSVWEFERKTHALLVHCCEEHGRAIMELIPFLDGSCRAEELRAMPRGRELLEILDDFALLESCVTTEKRVDGAQLTWLGHAAVLYEAANTRILVDPLFHPRSSPTRAGRDVPPDPRDVGKIDAVLITHGDNDHCNPQALARIRRDTPVFIPKPPREHLYQVDLRALLRLLGFSDVRELAPWERARVKHVDVVAAPFRGEDWGLELAACTWLIHHETLTAYLNADCVPMPDVYARLAREFRIDVGFLGVTGCAEAHLMPPGFGYGNFYSMWIPPRKRNQWIELCAGPAESAESAVMLGCRRAFGYAAGGADFVAMAFSDRGSHAQMEKILVERGLPEVPLRLQLGVPWQVPV